MEGPPQGQPPGGWQPPGYGGDPPPSYPPQQPPPPPPPPAYPPPQPQQPPYNPYAYQQPQQQQWGYYPQPPQEPGNSPAIVGFCLGVGSLALLLMSVGFLWPLTLGGSIAAIFVGRNGMKKVDAGETRKHRGLGQAGFITGIIGTILSLLALAACAALIASDDEDLENFFDEDLDSTRSALRVGAALLRASGLLG